MHETMVLARHEVVQVVFGLMHDFSAQLLQAKMSAHFQPTSHYKVAMRTFR
jgi:hypothetical protein